MHSQQRKWAKALSIASIASIALAGCAGGGNTQATEADLTAAPEYSGELSILTKFGVTELSPYFEDLAAAYEAEHPDVTINLIQEDDQSIKDKTKTLVASQSLPDIYFTWTGDWQAQFVNAGLAADLTEVISPDTEWGSTFGVGSLDAFVMDDNYYAIPLYNNSKFMGYNQAIFNELGLEEPETFEDLIETCGVIKEAGITPIAFGNKDGWPGLHYIQQLIAYNVPSETMRADWDPATATWDHPGYQKSMEEFQTLVNECTDSGAGANGVLYSTAIEALSNGQAAMYYQEILEFSRSESEGSVLAEDGFDIFPLPVPAQAEGDPDAIEGAPEGYIINSTSEQQALAVDFMKFVTNAENAATLAAPPFSQPSAVIGAVNEDTSTPSVVKAQDIANSATQLVGWLDTVTVPDVADAWLSGGQALVTAERTPEEILISVQEASTAAAE